MHNYANTRIFEKGISLSFIYICITFPIDLKISNIGIVLLLANWLGWVLTVKENKSSIFKKLLQPIPILFFLLFFWQAVSILYSDNLTLAWKNLEGKLSLIILPLILFTFRFTKSQLFLYSKYIVYSLSATCIFLLSVSIINYIQKGNFLIYHEFIEVLDLHAVIFSYYLFGGILLILHLLSSKKLESKETKLVIASGVIMLVSLVVSASKNVLVVSSIASIYYLYRAFSNNQLSKKSVLAVIVLLVISLGFALTFKPVKDRLSELTELNGIENFEKLKKNERLTHEDLIKFNGTTLRLAFWKIGIEQLLEKERLMIGLTPADRRAIINKEFERTGIAPAFKNYNLHNQFIQTFVELGLIGLLIYIVLHLSILKFAVKSKNHLLTIFFLAFFIFQITESVLERNKGLVFFLIMILFLIQHSKLSNENRNIRN